MEGLLGLAAAARAAGGAGRLVSGDGAPIGGRASEATALRARATTHDAGEAVRA